jgi:hypothetical protein
MRKLLSVIAAGALVLSACGGSGDGGPDPSDEPEAALIEALEDLGEEGFSMTLSLNSDTESLSALAADSGDAIPEDLSDTILDSSITFGSNAEQDPAEAQAEVTFELGGENAVEFLVDGYDVYGHADVAYIMETFGEDPAQLEQGLASIPPGFEWIEQAANGEWIHLTGLEEFQKQMEQSGQLSGDLTEQQKKAVDELVRALEENSEVTEGDEEGPGTHLEAKVNMQGIVQSFQSLVGDLTGVTGAADLPSSTDVPTGDLLVDAWVDEGTLTQMEFDILKNAELFGEEDPIPEGVEEFGVLLVFEDFGGDVDPPDDAVEVSFQEIFSAMLGAVPAFGESVESGSGAGGGGTSVDPCEEVAKLPAEQQEPFKDICPDL